MTEEGYYIRSGTSIGANVEEARAGQSKTDFINKNAIALKEARETRYWLRLLVATEILSSEKLSSLIAEAEELEKILGAIIVKSKKIEVKTLKKDLILDKVVDSEYFYYFTLSFG